MNLRGESTLKRLDLLPYSPLPWLTGGKTHSIAAHFWPQPKAPSPTKMHRVSIDCEDQLVVVEYASSTNNCRGTAILVHGLNGCYLSNYMQRFVAFLTKSGYRALCVNLRNCGPGFGYAKRMYNAGNWEDIQYVYDWCRDTFPNSPEVLGIGFSLGANIILGFAGKGNYEKDTTRIIAVSPPTDLLKCAHRLSLPENRVFDRIFAWQTARQYSAMQTVLAKAPQYRWTKHARLQEFDEKITAPLGGFSSAQEYYEKSASVSYLHRIEVPLLILTAHDDPVIDPEPLLAWTNVPAKTEIVVLAKGGHVAFLHRNPNDRFWMDRLAERWILAP